METHSEPVTVGAVPGQERSVVRAVIDQHVGDAAVLRSARSSLLRGPHVELKRLARLDERLTAHLDGALIAGEEGYRLAQAALERPGVGELFLVAVFAIERRDAQQLDRLLSLCEVLPEAVPALVSAFGWVGPAALRGLTASQLQSDHPLYRWIGIVACAAHGVDPGAVLADGLQQSNRLLRLSSLKAAGQLGRVDLLPLVLSRLHADEPAECLTAACAATLLGDRDEALRVLQKMALAMPDASLAALRTCLLAADHESAHALVSQLVAQGAPLRTVIRAAGWAGDVMAVPWLINQMADAAQARVAGEAFSQLTGADLALLDLDHKGAAAPATTPSDDPADDAVALDEDESLPWPDVAAVQAWWQHHAGGFPVGARCFGGAAASAEHCTQQLRTAGQRQRIAAALLLSLMAPGTPLFNVCAPAPRQQAQLGLPQKVI
jgi:uncharacterized protein (TIGR02270 family)